MGQCPLGQHLAYLYFEDEAVRRGITKRCYVDTVDFARAIRQASSIILSEPGQFVIRTQRGQGTTA